MLVLLLWQAIFISHCTWAMSTFVRSPYPPGLAVNYAKAYSILLEAPETTHKIRLDILLGFQSVFCGWSEKYTHESPELSFKHQPKLVMSSSPSFETCFVLLYVN